MNDNRRLCLPTLAEAQARFETLISLPQTCFHIPSGVGTLSEKYLHALLKHLFCPDTSYHEQKLGRFCADICCGDHVIEIQTRNLGALRRRLAVYPASGYSVTIVLPLVRKKYLRWLDPTTGEITEPRKSPRQGRFSDALKELYPLLPYLGDARIDVVLLLMDMEEIRNLDGFGKDKKRRSTRRDRRPLALIDRMHLQAKADYSNLIPSTLPDPFTAKDFAQHAGLSRRMGGYALSLLRGLGLIEQVGCVGRAYLWGRVF